MRLPVSSNNAPSLTPFIKVLTAPYSRSRISQKNPFQSESIIKKALVGAKDLMIKKTCPCQEPYLFCPVGPRTIKFFTRFLEFQ